MSLWNSSGSVLGLEERSLKLSDFPAITEILDAEGGGAGVTVNTRTATSLSAVWRAVALLSSQVASLPLIVYRRVGGLEAERARDHPLWRLLHEEPNQYMTQFVFRETLMRDILLWGNAFAEIERDRAGRPMALHHVAASEMSVSVDNRILRYRQAGQSSDLLPGDVLHVLGMSLDGIRGISVIGAARLSLGLGIAMERFGGSFFGNGAWPGIVLQHPGRLSDEAHARLTGSLDQYLRGPNKAHKLLVTEDGIKVEKFSIPPNDAQFLESRSFQIEEVARWFNIPPHKLGHKMGERPGGNLEASQIEFLTDSLRPWLIRFEQEITRKLISRQQRATVYVEHLVDAILRVDAETRHKILLESSGSSGYRTVNEARKLENMAPMDGGDTLPRAAAPPSQARTGDELASQARRELALRFADTQVRRDASRARAASKRGPDTFAGWVNRYCDDGQAVLVDFIRPLALARLAEVDTEVTPDEIAREVAHDYLGRMRDELLDLPAGELQASVEELASRWEASRARALVDAVDAAVKRRGEQNAA